MTTRYTNETTGVLDGTTNPPPQGDAAKLGGRKRSLIGTITLAAQADGDTIVLGKIPKGAVPVKVWLNTDTSLGSTTVAIGSTASAAKYKAAAVFTATSTPTPYMKGGAFGVKTTAEETIIATLAAAAAPGAGNLGFEFEFMLPEGG